MDPVASKSPSAMTEAGDGELVADVVVVDAMVEEDKAVEDASVVGVAVEVDVSVASVLLELGMASAVEDAAVVDESSVELGISTEEVVAAGLVVEGTLELVSVGSAVLLMVSTDVLDKAVGVTDVAEGDGAAEAVTR